MGARFEKSALIAALLLGLSFWADAAEIRVLSAATMSAVLDELGPEFERTTGHKLLIQFEVAAVIPKKIAAGEVFDVAIATRDGINNQIKAGRIDANPRADFAHAGMGVAMRAVASKPDVSSIDAFRRALLNARSVAYTEGDTGAHFESVLQRLGIAEEVKAKAVLRVGGVPVAQAVANGDAELGVTVISNIVLTRGANVAGPLPAEFQYYAVFAAGVSTKAKEPLAAKAFLEFLTAPTVGPVLRSKGMEPGAPK